MTLTQEQLDFFNEHGYLRHGRFLEEAELALLRNEYDRVFDEASKSNDFRNLAIHNGGDSQHKLEAPRKMFQIMNVCERSLHFRKLLYDSRLLNIVEDLIGPNIMLFHDQALFKPAHTGGPVPWHQDNGYWKCRPANLVSCWITLDDAFRENGAMQVIPGSHLKPASHGLAESDALLQIPVDESRAVVVDVPAGGCMFHHCQTFHYTQPNSTDHQRRAFAIHYMAPGTMIHSDPTTPAPMPVSWSRPMLRARV
ncbi:MAG: phytanoyl-CoA dioxygenase family protein [Verrucomicrobiae bacterium]|nr:phytanoyl-CoA dioxygenase family protein [Verrucomicrobiae bacterium]